MTKPTKQTASFLPWIVAPLCFAFGCSQVPSNVDVAGFLDGSPSKSSNTRRYVGPGGRHKAKRKHKQPNSPRSQQLFSAAKQAEQNGDFTAALQQYGKLTTEFPDHVEALHRLAVLQDKHGDPQASARMYLRAIHFSPDDADLICDYGYSRYIQGDLLQAESMLQRVIELDPKHARAHNNLGLVLARQGNDTQAIAAFQHAGNSADVAADNLRQARVAAQLSAAKKKPHTPSPALAKTHPATQIRDVKSVAKQLKPTNNRAPKSTKPVAARSANQSVKIAVQADTDSALLASLTADTPVSSARAEPRSRTTTTRLRSSLRR